MIKNKPEAYGISSDNLLCMVQELETFVEDIHSISVVCEIGRASCRERV